MTYQEIVAWCNKLVNGAGGLKAYHKKEVGYPPQHVDVVRFTIRALANPRCEGSEDVLKEIMEARKRKGG